MEDIQQLICDMFLGKPKKMKAHRHRCFHCGKVTKHIFCDDCQKLPTSVRKTYYKESENGRTRENKETT